MSRFSFVTAGESHGRELTVVVSGLPAGLTLDRARIDLELRRRQLGYGRGSRMKIESDSAEITGGIRGGETIGSPLSIRIVNRDFENWAGAMDPWSVDAAEVEKRRVHSPRPGHADLAGGIKYDRHDLRDVLERASARETASRVAAGAVAKELLRAFEIEIRSAVIAIGGVGNPTAAVSWEELGAIAIDSEVRLPQPALEAEAIAAIDAAREAGDTLGGAIVVVARGLPVGLGSYVQWDEKLDGKIAQAILSVHAVKAMAIGDGIEAAQMRGSLVHDPIEFDPARGYHRASNRAGGLEGGVTNGEDLVVRAFMKPIATVRSGLPSVDIDSREATRSQWERSDVSAVPACSVVCEAMLAIVLADALRAKFGGDSFGEMKRNYESYLQQVRRF